LPGTRTLRVRFRPTPVNVAVNLNGDEPALALSRRRGAAIRVPDEAGALAPLQLDELPAQVLESRRADSNRGPLHYEGRTSEGHASTRGHSRASSRWKLSSSSAFASDARARSCAIVCTRFVPARSQLLTCPPRAQLSTAWLLLRTLRVPHTAARAASSLYVKNSGWAILAPSRERLICTAIKLSPGCAGLSSRARYSKSGCSCTEITNPPVVLFRERAQKGGEL
jgi:hypothetical protein